VGQSVHRIEVDEGGALEFIRQGVGRTEHSSLSGYCPPAAVLFDRVRIWLAGHYRPAISRTAAALMDVRAMHRAALRRRPAAARQPRTGTTRSAAFGSAAIKRTRLQHVLRIQRERQPGADTDHSGRVVSYEYDGDGRAHLIWRHQGGWLRACDRPPRHRHLPPGRRSSASAISTSTRAAALRRSLRREPGDSTFSPHRTHRDFRPVARGGSRIGSFAKRLRARSRPRKDRKGEGETQPSRQVLEYHHLSPFWGRANRIPTEPQWPDRQ
jgi:hypothetical protein